MDRSIKIRETLYSQLKKLANKEGRFLKRLLDEAIEDFLLKKKKDK
jgi:predicted DNA-binding protein